MARLTADDVNALNDRHEQWRTKRNLFNSEFEDVRRFVRPNIPHFHSNRVTEGQKKTGNIFDSTATWAAVQLAGGLQGNMFPADERFFEFSLLNKRTEDLDFESQATLERWADEIYFELSKPISNFNGATHEVFMDLVSFGTGVVFQRYSVEHQSMNYMSIPLSQCVIMENDEGMIDALDREWWWTKRQLISAFGEENLPREVVEETGANKEFNIVHSVFPRKERDPNLEDKFNKPFASVHWIRGVDPEEAVVKEGGFDWFPYLVPRWSKLPGEVYGRSPAIDTMPDIVLCNIMMEQFVKAAQLNINPPIVVEEDGFLPPVDYGPSSLIYKTPGASDPVLLQTQGNFPVNLEILEQKRESIVRGFFVDFLMRPQKKERQTATEILDIREEMFRQIGPVIARLEKEYAMLAVQTAYLELNKAKRMPPATGALAQERIKLTMTSQAAKAQMGVKAGNIQRFIQDVVPLLQIDPNLLKIVDFNELGAAMAEYRNVTKRVLKSQEQVQAEIAQEQAQQQQMMQTQQLMDTAGAMKDVATAQEKGLAI
jgi:hypothetical protein